MMSQICRCCLKSNECCLKSSGCCLKSTDTTVVLLIYSSPQLNTCLFGYV